MTKEPTQQFNVRLPAEVCRKLNEAAQKHNAKTTDIVRRFVVLGLLGLDLEAENNDSGILVRKNGQERLVTFF